jgi:hypothetical protein
MEYRKIRLWKVKGAIFPGPLSFVAIVSAYYVNFTPEQAMEAQGEAEV